MAGWNNRNCCCETRAYTCADGAVDICCLTFSVSTWTHPLTLYTYKTSTTLYDPDDVCGYTSSAYHSNNHCGHALGIMCGFPYEVRVRWGIQFDGTITFTVFVGSYVCEDGAGIVGQFTHIITGLAADWYTTPITFTRDGRTYTIEVCPDPHTPFPEWPLSDVYLKAAATAQTHETRSLGTVLCGGPCDPFQSFLNFVFLSWVYNVCNDEITLSFSGAFFNGSVVVPYDNGAWVNDTHTIPVSAAFGSDFSVTVTATDSCNIPPPPPPCDAYSCFPECLVKECDGVVGAYALFYDASSAAACCIATDGQFTWDGTSYYSGKIGDPFLVACGYIEIWYECYSPVSSPVFRRRVKFTRMDGSSSESFINNPGTCEENPENFVDTFSLAAGTLGCIAGIDIDVFTNN